MNGLARILAGIFLVCMLTAPALSEQDTLTRIRERGVLVAGVKDSLPPFGYIDEKTRKIVGYDVDFATAIADK